MDILIKVILFFLIAGIAWKILKSILKVIILLVIIVAVYTVVTEGSILNFTAKTVTSSQSCVQRNHPTLPYFQRFDNKQF